MLKFSKERLKDAMLSEGFDVKHLAEKSSVGVTTIYEILNGKKKNPKSETLSKLAYAMGIAVEDFFFDDAFPLDDEFNKSVYDRPINKLESDWRKRVDKINNLDPATKKMIEKMVDAALDE
ncbi:helix-turn-helix transcriptional regulator [Clostridium frigidicarnis]|uniref:Transcriptional regulator, contains XRE-family HTH domain n=1 Tax=Clostridium frigidicarnis TaxID=84698 RepID=A0A1I0V426_9CLOT|nr:helix-turn-helix transcriptional regulator [Clostridium frigidicarnis]SFA70817.1 Transcriptional regulator, contains XRE-family HTH domain [Clostridium frigidicarnis]